MAGKLTIISNGRNEEVGVTIDGHRDSTLGHRDLKIDQFPVPFTLHSLFKEAVAKYVRPLHVRTESHWMTPAIVKNLLKSDSKEQDYQ